MGVLLGYVMDQWLNKITKWFYDLFNALFDAITGFTHDIFMWSVNTIFDAIASLIQAIPSPQFIQNTDIGTLVNQLPSFALYCVHNCKIPEAMLILLSGVFFRLARKLFTLGQW